ncbi:DinB family protein [Bacillus infantis]|uniref:DinB family protein n=1 Tax=Bacillus infantis TaxID=324767 RepID=UPI001CD78C24|nr:DinB family protein [Bacillus infantis]MCA1041966.1 DinB family protein [Bacillus infantis]
MRKEEIIEEKAKFIGWVQSLEQMEDQLWFLPFREGSWGTAAVVSHFITWDRFVISRRMPVLMSKEKIPSEKINADAMNMEARNYARLGISKQKLISEFAEAREELLSLLEKLEPERFQELYPGREMTIGQYFAGLIEHDHKHKKEIENHWERYVKQASRQ